VPLQPCELVRPVGLFRPRERVDLLRPRRDDPRVDRISGAASANCSAGPQAGGGKLESAFPCKSGVRACPVEIPWIPATAGLQGQGRGVRRDFHPPAVPGAEQVHLLPQQSGPPPAAVASSEDPRGTGRATGRTLRR